MERFETRAAAEAAGCVFGYDSDGSRFTVTRDGAQLGVAHFADFGEIVRDFNHTVVDPRFRGQGLSTLLAEFALTHDSTVGKQLAASCWFIQRVIERHPETVDGNGRATGRFAPTAD